MHEPVHWFVDIQLFMICKIDKFCARGCYSIILFIILLFTLFRILRFSSLFIYFSHFSFHWNCCTHTSWNWYHQCPRFNIRFWLWFSVDCFHHHCCSGGGGWCQSNIRYHCDQIMQVHLYFPFIWNRADVTNTI